MDPKDHRDGDDSSDHTKIESVPWDLVPADIRCTNRCEVCGMTIDGSFAIVCIPLQSKDDTNWLLLVFKRLYCLMIQRQLICVERNEGNLTGK